MTSKVTAQGDFEHALSRASLRRIITRLTGVSNQLLPFDEVRQHLPILGQHYAGVKQVELSSIIGSFGRYQDFDRIFLPTQRRTKERWIRIDQAHIESVPLPPIELFKIGEIYFVKDGNHRVSVARQRGQVYIDAVVIEIETPIIFTPDTTVDDLELQKEKHAFFEQTHLKEIRSQADIDFSLPELYQLALSHIEKHRWYLGEQQDKEVDYFQAVESWFDEIYEPLLKLVHENEIILEFPGTSQADLCMWLMQYQGLLGEGLQGKQDIDSEHLKTEAARQLLGSYPLPSVKKMISVLDRTGWLDRMLLKQEQAVFLMKTNILELLPDANFEVTLPGQYNRLVEHIAAHRWYLGEQQGSEVGYSQALNSWYHNVYFPIVEVICHEDLLGLFPGRTETDLYLWIISHQWHLREIYGNSMSIHDVALQYAKNFSGSKISRFLRRLLGKFSGKP